jgi:uncharacterized protein (TIGR03435 family)
MLIFRNTNLRNLLERAYMLRNYQIQGPGWIDTERYDVAAKVPEGAPRNEVPAMLRDLLVARFQLVTRRETRQEDVFVLSVAPNGPKLVKSQLDIAPGPDRTPNLVADSIEFSASGLKIPHATMATFANTLASMMGHPVLDETGVEGAFDFILDVSPREITAGHLGLGAEGVEAGEPTNTLAAAMKELGLNWRTRKAPVEHLVVEGGSRVPLGN